MSGIINSPNSKKRRRHFRKNMPKAERILWSKLRRCQLKGLRFRRQYSVFNYVIDFYCAAYKLAIEVVGDVHGYKKRIATDRTRMAKIESLGIKVLTYTNQEVIEQTEGVMQNIVSNLPPNPLLHKEGET